MEQIKRAQEREAVFFDERAEKYLELSPAQQEAALRVDLEKETGRYPGRYHLHYAYKILGDINGKNILDMGCGDGTSAVVLAKKGAFVKAFDISPRSVEVAKLNAKINNVQDKIKVDVMGAEDMKYGSSSFDLIFGVAILHHVNLAVALREVSRVLRNGGQAVFIEPIGFSDLFVKIRNLNIIKKMFPNKGKELLITEDERQINNRDLKLFKNVFRSVEYKSFELFSRLDRIIGGYPVSRNKNIIKAINKMDQILLENFRCLSKYGRWGVIRLSKQGER